MEKKVRITNLAVVLVFGILLSACGPIGKGMSSLKGELTGTNHPAIGDSDLAKNDIPESIEFQVAYDRAWQAALAALKAEGASIFEEDARSGKIVTDERMIEEQSWFDRMALIAPEYKATEYVTVEKVGRRVVIHHKARFTKILSGMLTTQNQVYPEAEKALRAQFFENLKKKI